MAFPNHAPYKTALGPRQAFVLHLINMFEKKSHNALASHVLFALFVMSSPPPLIAKLAHVSATQARSRYCIAHPSLWINKVGEFFSRLPPCTALYFRTFTSRLITLVEPCLFFRALQSAATNNAVPASCESSYMLRPHLTSCFPRQMRLMFVLYLLAVS